MNQKPLQKPPSNPLYPPPTSSNSSNPPLNIPPLIQSAQVNPHQRLISPPNNNNQFFIKPLHPQSNNNMIPRPIPPFEDPSSFKTLPNFESPKQRRPQKITGNMLFTAEAKKTNDLTDSFSKDHQKFFNTDPKITVPQCEQNHIHSLLMNAQNPPSSQQLQQQIIVQPGSSNKKPQQNLLTEVINIEETQINNNAQQQNPAMIPETNPHNTTISSNQMKTKISLENYYQTLNEIPNKVQERLQGHKPPEIWDLGLTDTLSFFKQLPHTNMDPEEFMYEEHHLEPQGMDLPTELLEDLTKSVENRTVKLHQDLKGVHDLFLYGQKVEKLFGDKTNQSINRTKEISSAFSGLSNYIWDCLQNQFQFPDGSVSQESTMSFQDVAEKVTSQKFFAEINDDPPTDDLLTFFHHLISQPSDPELNAELQNHIPELLAHDLLDQDLAKYLFGDSFDLQNVNIETNKTTMAPAEQELHNQFLTISQDLQQIPKHQHNMEEEPKASTTTLTFAPLNNQQQSDTKKSRRDSPPSHHMSEEKIKEGAQVQERVTRRLVKGAKTSASVTQMSVTQPSVTNQSETTGFPDHFMEFEEPFMPLGGLEEEVGGGFIGVGGFPFMSGESFPLGGFGSNEDEDIGSNNI